MTLHVGILTVSDRCSRGERTDLSGPMLSDLVREQGWAFMERMIVPDEKAMIGDVLKRWCDEKEYALVLTTGGTGVGPRDVTPEATKPLLEKELDGFAELMRREGSRHTPWAALSRSLAGVRKKSLLINLPGNPQGAKQSLQILIPLIPHTLAILRDEKEPHRELENAHDHA
jgi:molybdopterin adenylyltransferase